MLVDPLKRITISEIRLHPWFVVHLPRYLAVPPPDTLAQATNVDAETLEMVVNLGREPPRLGVPFCGGAGGALRLVDVVRFAHMGS